MLGAGMVMRVRLICATAGALSLGLVMMGQSPNGPMTLGRLLAENSLPVTKVPDASRALLGYGVGHEGAKTIVAYFGAQEEDAERFTFHLLRYDPAKGEVELRGIEPDGECGQQFWNIDASEGWIEITMNLNPSAGCVIVLDDRLKVVGEIPAYGILGRVRGWLILGGDMVHFAPIHPETLLMYHAATREQVTVYPQPVDAKRAAFTEKLRRVLPSKEWCRTNNMSCDPKDFTSEVGDVVVSPSGASFRFTVTMTASEGFGAKAEQQVEDETVAYVCSLRDGTWKCASR